MTLVTSEGGGPDDPDARKMEMLMAEASIANNPSGAVWLESISYQIITRQLKMNRALAISVNMAVNLGVEDQYPALPMSTDYLTNAAPDG